MIKMKQLLKLLLILSVICYKVDAQEFADTLKIDSNRYYCEYMLDANPKFLYGKDSLSRIIQEYLIKPIVENIDFQDIIGICLKIDMHGDLKQIIIPSDFEEILFTIIDRRVFISLFAKWEPGMVNGIEVNSIICYPVIFRFNS